uniref:Uncharacterized protein n=1 Tax=Zea mays TaxID=4577 RepID=C4J8B6_MAIZE|nr:unknown [Zea mays]
MIHIMLQGGTKAIHEKQKNKCYLKTQCSISE